MTSWKDRVSWTLSTQFSDMESTIDTRDKHIVQFPGIFQARTNDFLAITTKEKVKLGTKFIMRMQRFSSNYCLIGLV